MAEAKTIISKIIVFMKQAGELAIRKQSHIDFFDSKLKTDSVIHVVTQTDLAISSLFKEFVNKEFADINPLIVDEESVLNLGKEPLNKIRSSKYSVSCI